MTRVDRVLELVNESGLTAKEFAINAGIAGGSITDWKTGRSKPSVESLQKIAKYAGVSLEWLTGDSNYKTKKEEIKSLFKSYRDSLIALDVNTALIISSVKSKLSKHNNNFDDYLEDITLFFEQNNIQDITPKLIEEYISKFPKSQRSYLCNVIQEILNEALSAQKSREDYSILKILSNLNNFYMCPVYGQISAGIPNWAEECIEGRIPIDPELFNIVNPEECFFLRVNGESMNKLVKNGAYALIRKQDIVENGEIAAVLVNGYDATLKKFSKQGDLVVLEPMSDDSSFQVQIYDKNTPIQILGKYIGKFEMK